MHKCQEATWQSLKGWAFVQPRQLKALQSHHCPNLNWKRKIAKVPQCLISKIHLQQSIVGKCHVPVSAVLTYSFHQDVQRPASTDTGEAASIPPAGISCCSWPADELQSKRESCVIEAFSQGGPVKPGNLLPKHGNLLVSSL